jgi:hypothetical protein
VTTVVVLSGPPKAGKSRLRGDLYRALQDAERRARQSGRSLRWFVQAFSPDCEGQWVNDSHCLGRGEEAEGLARRAKQALKASGAFFSPEWVERTRRQLEGLARWADVIVADLGGLPSPENAQLVGTVWPTGPRVLPVVLTRDGEDGGWVAFWRAVKPALTPWYVGPYHEGLADRLADDAVGPLPEPGPSVAGVPDDVASLFRGAVRWHLRRLGEEGAFDEAAVADAAVAFWFRVRRDPDGAHPAVVAAAAVSAAMDMVRAAVRGARDDRVPGHAGSRLRPHAPDGAGRGVRDHRPCPGGVVRPALGRGAPRPGAGRRRRLRGGAPPPRARRVRVRGRGAERGVPRARGAPPRRL